MQTVVRRVSGIIRAGIRYAACRPRILIASGAGICLFILGLCLLDFIQPANTQVAAYALPVGSLYGDTTTYYCAHHATQGTAVAAACEASEMSASLMALQMQNNSGHTTHDCRSYDALFRRYNWNATLAEAICQAESGGNPAAISATHDYGLMQLHNLAVFDPAQNIAMAYVKYQTQGWSAWTTYNTGAYTRFL